MLPGSFSSLHLLTYLSLMFHSNCCAHPVSFGLEELHGVNCSRSVGTVHQKERGSHFSGSRERPELVAQDET